MKQYSTDSRQRMAQNRNRAMKEREKRNILIISAIVLAFIIIGGIIGITQLGKNRKQTEDFSSTAPAVTESTSAAETETQEESTSQSNTSTTAAVTETTSEKPASEVKTEDYSATMYSTTVTLNVRSEPNANCKIIGQVGMDTPIKITGKCDNGWYRVEFNGKTGYCSGKYLSTDKNPTTTKAEPSNTAKTGASPYLVRVNRTQNLVTVYGKDGNGNYTKPVKAMVCSVGLNGKTETGTFTIKAQQGKPEKSRWRLLSGGVYGQYITRFNGSILFHSVPYYSQNPADLEYEEYNKLGQAASLGCVRLAVIDAKWIYDNCPTGTTVEVYDSSAQEPLAKPTPIKINTSDVARRGWDPTDPDPNNPW